MRPNEPVGKHTAPQIRTKLVLDVARQRRLISLARVRQERFQVLANNAVEGHLGGTSGSIRGGEGGHDTVTFAVRVHGRYHGMARDWRGPAACTYYSPACIYYSPLARWSR